MPFQIQPLARLCNHPQANQATQMMACLPPTLIQMIDDGTWPGEGCMVLSSPISRPTAAEIAQNHCFLKPFVVTFPTKAPQVSKQRVVLSIQFVFNAGILQRLNLILFGYGVRSPSGAFWLFHSGLFPLP